MQGAGSPMPEKSFLPWIIGGIIVVAAGVIFFAMGNDARDEAGMMTSEDTVPMEGSDEAMMAKPGTYEAYDASRLAMAADGKVVLFFRASWCPTCRALDADIKKNLSAIPADVTILDVDYDRYADLKKRYGITTQHTLVQVDADGKELGKWVGSAGLAEIVKNVR